jgi:DNA-binding MarR family transcriptional regulator
LENEMADRTSIECLVKELYGLSNIKRDTQRRAFSASAMAKLWALAAIHRVGRARVGEVAEALHVDLSVASRQLSALTVEGHVKRERDAEDRRAHFVEVTDAGLEALREAHEKMIDAFSDAVVHWSDEDVRTLAASLARLREDYATAMNAAPEIKEAA